MPKCHNCGRETMRTEDWACLWCGHPLLYGPFKRIEKTYKQLKGERLYRNKREAGIILEQEQKTKPEEEMESKQDMEVIRGIQIEPELETGKEIAAVQPIEVEPEKEIVTEEIGQSQLKITPAMEKGSIQEMETKTEVELEFDKEEAYSQTITETRAKTNQKIDKKAEKEAELIEKRETGLVVEPADIELTVGEVLKAYEENDIDADAKFINKTLRITGTVSLVDIKEGLNIQYIRLTGNSGDPWQSMQCMFDSKYIKAFEQLEKGQTITVQGRYNGSVIAIRMVDCILVS